MTRYYMACDCGLRRDLSDWWLAAVIKWLCGQVAGVWEVRCAATSASRMKFTDGKWPNGRPGTSGTGLGV